MLYLPSLSVTAVRVLSIRAGLVASTVTPGSTAPDASLTRPAIPLAVACCATAAGGASSAHTMTLTPTTTTLVRAMNCLLPQHPCFPVCEFPAQRPDISSMWRPSCRRCHRLGGWSYGFLTRSVIIAEDDEVSTTTREQPEKARATVQSALKTTGRVCGRRVRRPRSAAMR